MISQTLRVVIAVTLGFLVGAVVFYREPETKLANPENKKKEAATSAASASKTNIQAASSAVSGVNQQIEGLLSDSWQTKARSFTEGLSVEQIRSSLEYLKGKKGNYVGSMKAALLASWARTDPSAAWAEAMKAPSDSERATLLGAVAATMAKSNPDAAMKFISSIPAPGLRKQVASSMLRGWSETDGLAALKYVLAHKELPIESIETSTLYRNVAEKDPTAAMALALQAPRESDSPYSDPLRTVFQKWMSDDSVAAMKWLKGLTDPAVKDRALSAYLNGGYEKNPTTALELINQISSSTVRLRAESDYFRKWVEQDPAAAVRYISQQDDATMQRLDFGIIYGLKGLSLAEQEGLLKQLPEGQAKSRILSRIVKQHGDAGRYADSIQMLNAMPDSTDRDRALFDVAMSWFKNKPSAMLDWVKQQADSSDKDLLLGGYATALSATDVSAALNVAMGIPDSGVRKGVIQNVMVNWLKKDRPAATAWMDANKPLIGSSRSMIESMSKYSFDMPSLPRVSKRR